MRCATVRTLQFFRARLANLLNESRPPTECRFIVNDSTAEKVLVLLSQNPRGLLQFRDDLVGFLKGLDREGRETDRAFYLECWNGDGHFQQDRISRETEEGLCLSILGGITPAPLEAYLRETFKDGRDDGFVQRFQMLEASASFNWRSASCARKCGSQLTRSAST